MKDKIDNFIV